MIKTIFCSNWDEVNSEIDNFYSTHPYAEILGVDVLKKDYGYNVVIETK